MSNRIVVCSNPEDDDYVGEEYNADYCNIVEHNWQELKQKIVRILRIYFTSIESGEETHF